MGQQTQLDGIMSVKIFGTTDSVLEMVMQKLRLKGKLTQTQSEYFRKCKQLLNWGLLLEKNGWKFSIPYDKRGDRLKNGSKERTVWNLRPGTKIKLHRGNNCKGSQQPQFSKLPGKVGVIERYDPKTCSIIARIEEQKVFIGGWWLEAAINATVPSLPIINV